MLGYDGYINGARAIVATIEERTPLVICPGCNGPLIGAGWSPTTAVVCGTCGRTFPVFDGVIDLLGTPPSRRSLAQATMESDLIVRIYESRLWRRSLMTSLALGISFDREQRIIGDAAGVGAGDTVLDLACGPGIYTRPFANRVLPGTVVGLDISKPMLRYASRRARELQVSNVLWIRGNAMVLPFPDERFAAVNCCGALHLFADVAQVLGGVHRVLARGGRFTCAAFSRPAGAVSARANTIRRSLFGLDAFNPEELHKHLSAAGFEDVQLHHRSFRWLVLSARRPVQP